MKIQLTLFALALSLCVEAQPPGVKPPPPPLPFDMPGTVPLYTSLGDLFHKNKEISKKHMFQILLKDSSSLLVEGKIDFDSASYYLSWTDKTVSKKDSGRIKKMYPGQTRSIAVVDDYGSITLLGRAAEDAWLFPVIKGQLTVYAPFAEDNLPDPLLLFVQDGKGPLNEMTMDYLNVLMHGNEKALNLLNKGKVRKAIEQFNE
ncbi:MAG TPA: hypothetical protein VGS79_01130 [Puia sp.]|nr:hypothetical protein [Puia sp.]